MDRRLAGMPDNAAPTTKPNPEPVDKSLEKGKMGGKLEEEEEEGTSKDIDVQGE